MVEMDDSTTCSMTCPRNAINGTNNPLNIDIINKDIALTFHDKIGKLAEKNIQLQQVTADNKQIEPLKLERNSDLIQQNLILTNELTICRNLNTKLVKKNDDLNQKISNFLFNLQSKDGCITDLKDKITKQYSDLQDNINEYAKLSSKYQAISNELNYLKKSENWYKNQLHKCQNKNENLINEMEEIRKKSTKQDQKIEELNLRITELNYEKENILYENLKKNKKKEIDNHHEKLIKHLKDENANIKRDADENREHFERTLKEDHERCEMLQKRLDEYEKNTNRLQGMVHVKENEMEKMENRISVLKTELSSKNDENNAIGKCIRNVKQQFNHFKQKYELLQNDNLSLQTIKNNLESKLIKVQTIFNNDNLIKLNGFGNLLKKVQMNDDTFLDELENYLKSKSLMKKKNDCMLEKIGKLQKKSELIRMKSEETTRLVDLISQQKNLRIGDEERRRYESNLRTLLNKVKEQTKGRKKAEKQLEQLNRLHEDLLKRFDLIKIQNSEILQGIHEESTQEYKIIRLTNEKLFLQRLCNDLKVTLKTHLDYNKTLKERLAVLTHEKDGFYSLPNFSTIREDRIEALIRQSNLAAKEQPLGEVRDSLDDLRNDICNLQRTIAIFR